MKEYRFEHRKYAVGWSDGDYTCEGENRIWMCGREFERITGLSAPVVVLQLHVDAPAQPHWAVTAEQQEYDPWNEENLSQCEFEEKDGEWILVDGERVFCDPSVWDMFNDFGPCYVTVRGETLTGDPVENTSRLAPSHLPGFEED